METDHWLGLELRHLIALKAIAEEGTFGRAAEHLGYTQSAISQQIAMLERIVGQRLIDRPGGPRPVSRSPRRVSCSSVTRMRSRRASWPPRPISPRSMPASPARFGSGHTRASVPGSCPICCAEFKAEWPDIEITLKEEADDGKLVESVERGELDLSFVVLPLEPGPCETVELFRDPYVLVVPADSPLASRERTPSLRELLEHPLIANRTCRTTTRVEERLRLAGREPHIVLRTDDNGTVQGLVAAGMGIAIVPLLTVDVTDTSIQVVDLGERVPPRLIGLAWHRDRRRTRAAEAFVELAQKATSTVGVATEAA